MAADLVAGSGIGSMPLEDKTPVANKPLMENRG
jgi:hypothetical protein